MLLVDLQVAAEQVVDRAVLGLRPPVRLDVTVAGQTPARLATPEADALGRAPLTVLAPLEQAAVRAAAAAAIRRRDARTG